MTEAIETPPIVLMEEADFVTKLNEHFDQLKATLAADVVGLDKAQTKALMQTVIHDIWFANVEVAEDKTKMQT